MKKKKDNNLICINYADGEKRYYTSCNRCGIVLGLAATSVVWAIQNENVLSDNNDRKLTITIVDGSKITYDKINNN